MNKKDWSPANEWTCHFWCDPVMPGSLGIEAMMQCLEMYSVATDQARGMQRPAFNHDVGKTQWKYRGQLTPKNDRMDCEVHVKSVERTAGRVTLVADGCLFVDRLRVYSATDLRLVVEDLSLLVGGWGAMPKAVAAAVPLLPTTPAQLRLLPAPFVKDHTIRGPAPPCVPCASSVPLCALRVVSLCPVLLQIRPSRRVDAVCGNKAILSEGNPVLPMTASLELLASTVLDAHPGYGPSPWRLPCSLASSAPASCSHPSLGSWHLVAVENCVLFSGIKLGQNSSRPLDPWPCTLHPRCPRKNAVMACRGVLL